MRLMFRDFRSIIMCKSYFFRRDKKILIIVLLLLYIFYEKLFSQQCKKTWTLSALLSKESNEDTILRKETTEYENYEYVVLIASAPNNHARRASIRNSWMKLANIKGTEHENKIKWRGMKSKNIKFFFVVGTGGLETYDKLQLNRENSNGDILLFDFVDSYNTLTLKMLLSLTWLSENMKGLKYLIKCDDDSFLRIDLIVHNLEMYAPTMDAPDIRKYISQQEHPKYKGLYWGYFNGRAKVFKRGKWEEKKWFLCDRYLPYALGGAYVISRNIVDYIARNADDLSQYNSEDVSMGVWTSSLDAINRVHDLRFDTSAKSRGCSDDMLVRHKVSANDMTEIYRTLKNSNGKKICKGEGVNNYYVYDWTVSPSMCCKEK